jgi:hypothetical protein
MKLAKLLTVAGLSLLLGTAALVFAQEDAKPQDAKPQDNVKAQQQPEAKPQKQDDKDKKDDKAAPANKSDNKTPDNMGRQDNKMGKPSNATPAAQAAPANQPAQRGGGHIPDDKFKANFGRQHTFTVNRINTSGGQPQFQYSGYTFTIVDAWPAGWAYTDQCYIDYIDGEYFLFDLLHPGVQVALIVVL